ncbi:MAG: hypothetical protein U0871_18690 [Gemmataceae bacterium]
MNAYRLSDDPAMRVPGLVDQMGEEDQLNITLAVPCLPNGEVESKTQDEYEGLADEYFEQFRPGQEMA